jgi:hypothetical protein
MEIAHHVSAQSSRYTRPQNPKRFTIHEMTNTLGLTDDQIESRHPGTQHLIECFDHATHHAGYASDENAVAGFFDDLAARVVKVIGDGPELTAGLRELLQAKTTLLRAFSLDQQTRAIQEQAAADNKVSTT